MRIENFGGLARKKEIEGLLLLISDTLALP